MKLNFIRIVIAVIIAISVQLLNGCDASQNASGVVVDKETHKPISHVTIGRYNPETDKDTDRCEVFSDSEGRFRFACIGMTNSFDLYFSKIHYWQKKVSSSNLGWGDTIFLEYDHKDDSVPSENVNSKRIPDTVFDEYNGLDSLPELQTENFYTGPGGEALNIEPDKALMANYIKLSHDSSAPSMRLLINIDSNGNVTDCKLQDMCNDGIIYYDDTIHTKIYDQLGNEFWKLALKEVKKYPKWKPGYIGKKRVRALHHIIVVFSKEKVSDDDN